MIHRLAWWPIGLAILAGCGINMETRPLPATHPASAEAAEGSYAPPPNVLSGDLPTPPPREGTDPHHDHEHGGHGGHSTAPAGPVRPYPLTTCLVGGEELGKMGKPEVMIAEGREIKFCCGACIQTFKKDPAKYFRMLDEAEKKNAPEAQKPDPHHEHEEKK